MNRENIQKVRDAIAVLPPERFSMEKWACRPAETGLRWYVQNATDLLHDCGTCGCIGGWTNAILSGPEGVRGDSNDAATAGGLLGLSPSVARSLFYPYQEWSDISRDDAVRVLDHLLATGEVDWKSTRRAKKAVS